MIHQTNPNKMKNLIVLMISFFALNTTSFAQQTDFKAARKTMKKIEKQMIKDGTNADAMALINASKEANRASKTYLNSTEGYAEIANDKRAKKQFRRNLKKEDANYSALLKEAKEAKIQKVNYISSINAEYKAAADIVKSKVKNKRGKRKAKL